MKSPNWEALKEIARWAVLFVVSWILTETLKQISLVPETATLKVYVFAYVIPVRLLFMTGLTFAGRYVDKYLWIKNDQSQRLKVAGEKTTGLLPF